MKAYEYDDLLDLINKRGWAVYQNILQKEFDKEYKRLRNITTEKDLNTVNGYLNGIERAIKLVTREIESYTPEEQKGD